MKPNNLYYRDILTILEPSQEYAKFYSTMYYLRRIAMHYGASYTGRKCSNKYIKDWAIAMGVTDDGQHHVNYYWIKRIAKKLVPSTADDLSENTYLRIISENISHQLSIKTFINNVEVDNTQTIPPTILSYADSENAVFKFVVTDEEDNPFQGYSIPFSVGGVDQTPLTTDVNGEATYTYQSSGVGDTDVSINCSLVSKTYIIHDTIKYIPSELTSSQTLSVPNLPTNFKCSFKVSNVANSGKSSYLQIGSDTNNCLCIGNSGGRTLAILIRVSGSYATMQYQENVLQTGTDNLIEYSYKDGSQTIKCNGTTVTLSNTQITARNYVGSYINNSNMEEIIFEPL